MVNSINNGAKLFLSLPLIFFLFSCSTPCRQWVLDYTLTPSHYFNSGRMLLCPSGPDSNIEIEIFRGPTGTFMFLNVASLPLPYSGGDDTVEVQVCIDDVLTTFIAERFWGGQRAKLPEEATCQIIEALLNYQHVTLSIGGRYHAEIVSTKFELLYQKLNSLPMIER